MECDINSLFQVISNFIRIENRDRVFRNWLYDRYDIDFLHTQLAHTQRPPVLVEHAIRPFNLARNEQCRGGIQPRPRNASNSVRTTGPGGHHANAKMIGGFRVSLGTDGAGLLMRIAHGCNPSLHAERVIQVHGAAASHQKDVFDALFSDKPDYVVRELHWSEWDCEWSRNGTGYSLVKTSWDLSPRAANMASINSRTAPWPPRAVVTKLASCNTAATALAGAADSPTIAIADRSLTSSPMKQTSSSFTPAVLENCRRAAALFRHPFTTCLISIF